MSKLQSIPFMTDDNTEVKFFVLEQTTINGRNYLLVSEECDPGQEDALVYIMKETEASSDGLVSYEFVEEEVELELVSKVFEQLMDDDLNIEVD